MYVPLSLSLSLYLTICRHRCMPVSLRMHTCTHALARSVTISPPIGRGDDTVGNRHRAQISQFELFEMILLLKLDKQLPVEQFEATVSVNSTLPPSYTSSSSCLNSDHLWANILLLYYCYIITAILLRYSYYITTILLLYPGLHGRRWHDLPAEHLLVPGPWPSAPVSVAASDPLPKNNGQKGRPNFDLKTSIWNVAPCLR